MPYSHGQPKKRRGPHPVVGDMNRRIRGDRRAAGGGGGCAIVLIVALGGVLASLAVVTYAAVRIVL